MAYDRQLADRIDAALADVDDVTDRLMFGGIAFLVAGNMCVGVTGEDLMVRLGPDRAGEALAEPHVRPMDFTGKPLKNFVYVAPQGVATDEALQSWIDRAMTFIETLPPKV